MYLIDIMKKKESWVDISKNTTVFHTLEITNTSKLYFKIF